MWDFFSERRTKLLISRSDRFLRLQAHVLFIGRGSVLMEEAIIKFTAEIKL